MSERFGVRKLEVRTVTGPPTGSMFGPTGYLNTGYPQMDQFDSGSAINGAYLAEMYTYRCIQTITRSITAQPFRMGADPVNKKSFDKNHPLAKLLGIESNGRPNDYWSSMQLLKYAIAQYVLTGKWAWEFGLDVSGKDQLWPLMIQALRPIPGGPTANAYFTGFAYGQKGTKNYRELQPDQLAYFWNPSLADVRQPESVIQAGQLNISILRMINFYNEAFLKNNATPSTLVITPPFAEDEERRAFQDQFVAEFGGFQNAGRTAFLEAEDSDSPGQGVGNVASTTSVSRLASTAQESEMRQLTEDEKNAICLQWGVPRSMMGDSTNAKYTNIEQDRRNFWNITASPIASEIADQINTNLAPKFGSQRGWFDLSSVKEMQPDTFITGINLVDLIANHVVTRDEARAEMGYLPWEDVDPENTPFGVQPGEGVATASKTDPVAKEYHDVPAQGGGNVGQVAKPLELPPATVPTRHAVDMLTAARKRREARHAGPDGHRHITSGHVTLNTATALLNSNLQQMLGRQVAEVNARLSGQRGARKQREGRANPASLYDQEYWRDRTEDILVDTFGTETAQRIANLSTEDVLRMLSSNDADPVDVLRRANESLIRIVEAKLGVSA